MRRFKQDLNYILDRLVIFNELNYLLQKQCEIYQKPRGKPLYTLVLLPK